MWAAISHGGVASSALTVRSLHGRLELLSGGSRMCWRLVPDAGFPGSLHEAPRTPCQLNPVGW